MQRAGERARGANGGGPRRRSAGSNPQPANPSSCNPANNHRSACISPRCWLTTAAFAVPRSHLPRLLNA
eukprot:3821347-Alexandrium_andersonii.AAC.1